VAEICARWEVRATVVGKVTAPHPADGGRLRIRDGFEGEILADVPAASLADDAPLYDRPRTKPATMASPPLAPPEDGAGDLLRLLRSPRWVFRQYDHQLFLNTVVGPGADAALLRLAGPGLPDSVRGVALTTDSNPRYCALEPRLGTALTLAEGVANLACVGATPVAVVNCLNFGNPEHPEVMWQLSECIDGMAEACDALSLPVIGGNVSLYNESGGADIDPTPVLGVLGLVDVVAAPPPGLAWQEGDTLIHLGARAAGDGSFPLDGTRWATECRQHRGGTLPAIDLERHRAVCGFVAGLVATIVSGDPQPPLLSAVHDVSSGGLAVALGEMAVAAGSGCAVAIDDPSELFTELPSRFVVATAMPDELCARAENLGIPAFVLGRAGGDRFGVGDLIDLPLADVRQAYDGNLGQLLGDS
jgi:phosphoribosylformylglycinamidine synthase